MQEQVVDADELYKRIPAARLLLQQLQPVFGVHGMAELESLQQISQAMKLSGFDLAPEQLVTPYKHAVEGGALPIRSAGNLLWFIPLKKLDSIADDARTGFSPDGKTQPTAAVPEVPLLPSAGWRSSAVLLFDIGGRVRDRTNALQKLRAFKTHLADRGVRRLLRVAITYFEKAWWSTSTLPAQQDEDDEDAYGAAACKARSVVHAVELLRELPQPAGSGDLVGGDTSSSSSRSSSSSSSSSNSDDEDDGSSSCSGDGEDAARSCGDEAGTGGGEGCMSDSGQARATSSASEAEIARQDLARLCEAGAAVQIQNAADMRKLQVAAALDCDRSPWGASRKTEVVVINPGLAACMVKGPLAGDMRLGFARMRLAAHIDHGLRKVADVAVKERLVLKAARRLDKVATQQVHEDEHDDVPGIIQAMDNELVFFFHEQQRKGREAARRGQASKKQRHG